MPNPDTRFETLIERHHDEIYRYLWRLLRTAGRTDCAEEAQDIAQDVFVRAYRAFPRLKAGNHRAWLYKIATNCAHTVLTQGQRLDRHTVPLLDEIDQATGEGQSPEGWVTRVETLEAIRCEIALLPPKQRMAVVLRHIQGLDYAAIAEALECSQDSARANVYQGLRRLRRVFVE
jgi:RNA polymerase sigma-70 factor (ECF subfamily)